MRVQTAHNSMNDYLWFCLLPGAGHSIVMWHKAAISAENYKVMMQFKKVHGDI